ncbi:M14 family zinc carboxypeptidase [Fibrella forsythiae]|uniref:T9SS type A sorting domain-containing protein n=1 Tax=Fibrella forsythiae TaxID=2817061 RepID=A0ABS3JFJ7_9BACT|nr:M14 family zinc carboxypeptidase [Fibrella forsythiae]MBO0948757.1 T9SS type A sorting domain-containing protein [Fibrella forsythiae]
MKKIYLFSFLLTFLCTTQAVRAQRTIYHRIQLSISPEKLEYLFNHGLEVDHFGYENKQDFTAEVSEQDVALIKRNGHRVTYLIKDLEKNYTAINREIDRQAALDRKTARLATASTPTNFSLGTYAGYYSYAELPAILDKMRTLYPNLITVKTSIGNSVGGRPLYMVKISDNPDVDENEPEMLLNALHHAREPVSLSQLIFFMWHMLENYASDKEIRTLLNSSEIYIVPCVNPDGYVYNQTTNPTGGGLWRKNRQANANGTFGVDLNRNYSYNYARDNTGSSPTPSSDTYRGTAAFSEPETAALQTFAAQRQFVTALNFHSYSNACIYPFESLNPNSNVELATFRNAATYMTVENGFKIGNAFETVGYTANGTAPDWEFGEQVAKSKMYGFTPEIGTSADGFWPASSRIIPLSQSMIDMNRKFLRISTYYGRATVSQPLAVTQASGTLAYQFQNFSIKPTSYTVSATSLSASVTAVGAANTHSGLALLQTTPGTIAFTVAAATPAGTSLPFEVAVHNGLSVIKDTVTLLYSPSCGAPVGLAAASVTETSATLSWSAVSGATSYAVSVKPRSTTAWPADVNVSGTTYAAFALTSNTDYDWRVKPTCGTYATGTFKTLLQTCFTENSGQVVFEAENFKTAVVGTGTAAGRTWSSVAVGTASGGQAMAASGTGINLQNSLVGPRLDYSVNFTTTGTYYVWVRMAAGTSGTTDDSFHLGLDGTAVTLNPNTSNYNNGNTAWTWIKAAGTTAFKVVVSTPGSHTLNLWMREDGTRVDKFILTTRSTYTPTGTGPTSSAACGGSVTSSSVVGQPRLGVDNESTPTMEVLAYPNPFVETITVKTVPNGQSSSLRLLQTNGTSVSQSTIPGTASETVLSTKSLPGGLYFIELIRDNQRRVIPVLKQ